MGRDRQKGIRWLLGFVIFLLSSQIQTSESDGLFCLIVGEVWADNTNSVEEADLNKAADSIARGGEQLVRRIGDSIGGTFNKLTRDEEAQNLIVQLQSLLRNYEQNIDKLSKARKDTQSGANIGSAPYKALEKYYEKKVEQNSRELKGLLQALVKRYSVMSDNQIEVVRSILKKHHGPATPSLIIIGWLERFPVRKEEPVVKKTQDQKTSPGKNSTRSRSVDRNKGRPKEHIDGSRLPEDRGPEGEYEEEYPEDRGPDSEYEEEYPEDRGPDGEYEEESLKIAVPTANTKKSTLKIAVPTANTKKSTLKIAVPTASTMIVI